MYKKVKKISKRKSTRLYSIQNICQFDDEKKTVFWMDKG